MASVQCEARARDMAGFVADEAAAVRAAQQRARVEAFNRRQRRERGYDDGDGDDDGVRRRTRAASGEHDDETRSGDAASSREREEPPQCRICFAGAEDATRGRLFSPCLCRGSMSHVHVECLNAWRAMSSNASSSARCDACRYVYVLKRARWATRFADPRLATVASVACIALAVVVSGVIARIASARVVAPAFAAAAAALKQTGTGTRTSGVVATLERLGSPRPTHAWRPWYVANGGGFPAGWVEERAAAASTRRALERTSPAHLEFLFYRLAMWTPPWWNPGGAFLDAFTIPRWFLRRAWIADALDALVTGVVLVGVGGAAFDVVGRLRRNFRSELERLAFPLAAMFASHGSPILRVVAIAGLMYVYYITHEIVRSRARTVLTKYGEYISDVRPRGAAEIEAARRGADAAVVADARRRWGARYFEGW